MKKSRPKRRVWKAWCGFDTGRPAVAPSKPLICGSGNDLNQDGIGLFRSRWKAKRGFEDVRRVEIRLAPAKRKAR